jgi:hypothetical protein
VTFSTTNPHFPQAVKAGAAPTSVSITNNVSRAQQFLNFMSKASRLVHRANAARPAKRNYSRIFAVKLARESSCTV